MTAQPPSPPSPTEIQALRASRAETQLQFGRAVGLQGADESVQVHVSRWEHGHRVPDAWHSMRLWEMMGDATP